MIKKADIVLFFVILVFGLLISWYSIASAVTGQQVIITAGGQVYGTYDLMQDQEIEVTQQGHQNHITIKDGKVSMTFSDCHNQVCVQTGAIGQTNQTIVCLPNQVIVEIVAKAGNQGGDADVITG